MSADLSLGAATRYEPSLRMEVRRGFHCCGIANPTGLTHCPACGVIGEAATIKNADQVVMTYPVLARFLFWVAGCLRALAGRFE